MTGLLRVCAYQGREPLTAAAALAAMAAVAAEAVERRAELLLFPECYLTGYATAIDEARRRAIPRDSPTLRLARNALRRLPIAVLGFLEVAPAGVYNSAAVMAFGELIGVYRKQRPNEHGFLEGDDSGFFEIGGARFGVNICSDANYPELAAALSCAGSRLIVYPLNNMLRRKTAATWRKRHLENLVARARETVGWVLSADVVGETEDSIGYGCTICVDPSGQVRHRVAELTEGLLVADIARAQTP
jgi:predicted amidohydrolase